MELYVRKLPELSERLHWICRKIVRGKYIPYTDAASPRGYAFASKAKAERVARELEAPGRAKE